MIKLTLLTFFYRGNDDASLLVIISTSVLCVGLINQPWAAYVTFKKYFRTGLMKYLVNQVINFFVAALCVCIAYPLFSFLDKALLDCSIYVVFVIKIIFCLVVSNVLFFLFYYRTKRFSLAKDFVCNKILR
jgi:hypothetical protein